MKRSELEGSPYLQDDRVIIECETTVIKEPGVRQTSSVFEARVPSSDLLDILGRLLEAQGAADVIIKVKSH
jgi:speckle-type POZ protein